MLDGPMRSFRLVWHRLLSFNEWQITPPHLGLMVSVAMEKFAPGAILGRMTAMPQSIQSIDLA